MLSGYGYIALFAIIAVGFAVTTILMPVTLTRMGIIPRRPNPVKYEVFECGMKTIGKTWVQFNFRYYYYALIFLAIDVLVIFLYPWAVSLRSVSYSGLIAIVILLAIVITGYLYAWKKKVFEWK